MKIICIGRNYVEHIKELDNERPSAPIIFMKPETALLQNNSPFYYPDFSNDIHHEVELLIKIDKTGKSVRPNYAYKYYQEIGLGIDFTARDIQTKAKKNGHPWELAKAFNHSAPVSDFLPKIAHNLSNLSFHLLKNGQVVQKGNTSLMIWSIDELISYISRFILLKKGDIIFTGTPAGVGPIKIGDHLEGFLEEKKMFDFKIK